MEVIFPADTQAKLDSAAAEAQIGTAEYLQQLVVNYVDHDLWFRRQVQEGFEQLDRGEFVTHEEVGDRISRFLNHGADTVVAEGGGGVCPSN